MKKFKRLSLFLCLTVLLQCIYMPVFATETTGTQENTDVLNSISQQEPPAFGTVCIQNGCRTIEGMVPLGGSERRLDTALGAFLFEMNTGTVIYSYNPDLKLAPGSLVKMVTAIVALEHCELEDMVTVAPGIKSRLPKSTLDMDLTSDEVISVKDLLHGLLLISANDAAVALAEHIAGNSQAYLNLMNNWVKQIGCTNTEFASVHGVDGGASYSTARDMAKIVQAAIKNEDFKTIFGTPNHEIAATNKVEAREFDTMNYMIDQMIIPDFYDTRVKGGIASYETSSGACIACIAEYNNMNLVCVVLGSTRVHADNGWSVVSYGNFNEATELLSFAFNGYKVNRIIYDGMSLSQFKVAGGESNAVGQAIVDIDSVVPADAQMDNLIFEYSVTGGGLSAPVAKDELIATVAVKFRNSCLTEVEVYSMGDVKVAGETGVTVETVVGSGDTGGSAFLSVLGIICVIILGLAMAYLAFNAYMRSRMRARRRKRREARRRNR